jgi:dipeptidyl aminopeptidase/acylaminoacyl peptidase
MSDPTTASYGEWESPFPISLLTAGVVTLGEVRAIDGVRWWLEGRPDEKGRQVLVRRNPDGTETRLTPEGFNARTRVHEYGGAAYVVDGDIIIVSDFDTGRLNRVGDGELTPLTPDRAWRFADLVVDRTRNRLLAIREDHEAETIARHGEAENSLVSIDLDSGEVGVLVSGPDFIAAPRLSPTGDQLAWLEWSHPNLPWDGTELRLAEVAPDGSIGETLTVAGSPTDWIAQPRWSPDGVLHFVAEPNGWMNIHRLVDGAAEPLAELEAEFAPPDWLFGYSSYGFLADGSIVAVGRSGGQDRLYRIGPKPGVADVIEAPFTEMASVAVDGGRVVLRVASPTSASAIVELDPETGATSVLRQSMSAIFDPADIAVAKPVEFPTTAGRTAFGLFYAPQNPAFRGPAGELPPLIVTSHGGPTAAAYSAFFVSTQLFTSRGFAVLDVDYGGSTGYGRDYRKRLEGEWGVVDLDDCVNGARGLVAQGLVDGERLAIRGGSASGYTTLCAVTFSETFQAGTSYFGIGDLETFIAQTHKFESRYLDRLVGPYPERKGLYRDRSPLNFADQISCPVLILQGAEDRIVPPAQAEQIVDALWEKKLPHAYLLFPGEDHGFRAAENIVRSFEAELSFYGQIFGYRPADRIEPIVVEFLKPASPAG